MKDVDSDTAAKRRKLLPSSGPDTKNGESYGNTLIECEPWAHGWAVINGQAICQRCGQMGVISAGSWLSDKEKEVIDLSVAINNTVSIECGECGEHAWETVGTSSSDTRVQDFARTVWKHGWVVKDNIALCPNCHEEDR